MLKVLLNKVLKDTCVVFYARNYFGESRTLGIYN